MKRQSRQWLIILALLILAPVATRAEPLVSPTWGFSIDLPEGYTLVDGDGQSRFSFASDSGARCDLIVYPAERFPTIDAVSRFAVEGLHAESESSDFMYRGKRAILMSLAFKTQDGPVEGWGLCLELSPPAQAGKAGAKATLLALAYGMAGEEGLDGFHRSALDSIAPTQADRHAAGPLSTFAYPPTKRKSVSIAGLDAEATIDESDAEAARSLVDREFAVLTHYANSPLWKEAWTRFYRAIFRDSYERLADIAFTVERSLSAPGKKNPEKAPSKETTDADRLFAERALGWIQGFAYERNLMGSDFVDLVTSATEGRGDCDSRALLLAVILMRADMEAAIMVSRDYSHAMGLVDVGGTGARFDFEGKKWVVAETTAKVPLGLIGKDKADPAKWLGIVFE
jgi:hypothetical protein